MDGNIIIYLVLFSFGVALAIGAWQFWSARKARDEHQRSAAAIGRHEPRVPGGPRPP